MVPNLLPLLPRHTVYVEPFCGGAALFWAKDKPQGNAHHYREVLNDKNQAIITLYKVMQDPTMAKELIHRLIFTPYSKDEYRRAQAIYKAGSDCPMETAWALFVNANMSFSNQISGGWSYALYGRNQADTWANRLKRLADHFHRLEGVYIENDDALSVIKKWDSPQTLFYCDPPYPGADQGHYNGYTHDDLKALCELLETCEGSFLLSNYPQDYIPSHWERFEFEARMSAAKDKTLETKRTEVVYRMDRSANMRPELLDLFNEKTNDQLTLF